MGTKLKKINEIKSSPLLESVWSVVLFNCYCHSFDEAVEQVMISLPCGYSVAFGFAKTAEQTGSATVFSGSLGECERIASILGRTGLVVSVAQ